MCFWFYLAPISCPLDSNDELIWCWSSCWSPKVLSRFTLSDVRCTGWTWQRMVCYNRKCLSDQSVYGAHSLWHFYMFGYILDFILSYFNYLLAHQWDMSEWGEADIIIWMIINQGLLVCSEYSHVRKRVFTGLCSPIKDKVYPLCFYRN